MGFFQNIGDSISQGFTDLKEHTGEFLDPTDPDYGLDVSKIPVIGSVFESACEKKEDCTNVNKINDNGLLVKGAGGIGGGLLGYKLGENFGTLGKLAGGVIGAYVGCKLSKEVATDVAAAADYTKSNATDDKKRKVSMLSATIANFGDLGGQKYTGKTVDNDTADITD